MNYQNRIKEIRESMEMTQQNVSDILGISRGTYSHYEIESDIIPISHLIKFCDYFSISLDYIFEFSIDKTPKIFNNTNELIAGNRLKTWRKNNKITQEKIASDINTNRSVIANYERGRNYIATPFLYTICKKYEVSADYLMGRID